MDLDKIKYQAFSNRLQVFVFSIKTGYISETCNTLYDFSRFYNESIYGVFPFLESLKNAFLELEIEKENLHFDWVNVSNDFVKGFFDFTFRKINHQNILCTFFENSDSYNKILDIQQKRNEQIIDIEKLELKQKTIQLEQDILKLRNEELERINEFKTQFYAKISHEIRTPINGIVGLSNLLKSNKESKLEPLETRYLDAIQASASHLTNIVNEFLDLTKIEAGKIKFESVAFNLKEILKNICISFDYVAKEKNLSIVTKLPENGVFDLIGDPTRLIQILFNLMGNAVKFSENATIEIQVKTIEQNTLKTKLKFEIIDQGIGIPKNKLSSVFQSYEQADDSITRKFGGTGLGLHIVKQLVELQGGKVGVESKLGKGSTFYFDLEFGINNSPRAKNKLQNNLIKNNFNNQKISILVAEDHKINQLVIENVLKNFSFSYKIVSNGLAAIEQLKIQNFDLILMDIHMPKMNGYDAVKAIRALPNQKNKIPVLALTGSVFTEDVDFKMLGFDDYLIKPFNKEDLISKINTLASSDKLLV